APLPAEDAGGDGPSRRTALPDRPPVVGALAEARLLRGRNGDAASALKGDRAGAAAVAARQRRTRDRDTGARHAGTHIAVGVPDYSQDPGPRQRLRFTRLPRGAARLAVARRCVRRAAARARSVS